jgi:hypothetical protein
MVGGATSAFISRRLRTAQPRALREHGIDPSGIPVGCTVAISRHHSILRLISVSLTTRKISGFFAVAVRENFDPMEKPAMICFWCGAQSKMSAYRVF